MSAAELQLSMGRLTADQVMVLLGKRYSVQKHSPPLLEFLENTAKGNPRCIHGCCVMIQPTVIE